MEAYRDFIIGVVVAGYILFWTFALGNMGGLLYDRTDNFVQLLQIQRQ
jgi:hypothetical protein